jgi:hypothetical protein
MSWGLLRLVRPDRLAALRHSMAVVSVGAAQPCIWPRTPLVAL